MSSPKLTKTGIPYLDFAWNVTSGCSWAGAGCDNCYAKALHTKRHEAFKAGKSMPECYREPFSTIQLHEDRLQAAITRRKPAVIGVCFMSDLFHPGVPGDFIVQVFGMMSLCPQHRFVVLTKRPDRMQKLLSSDAFVESVWQFNGGGMVDYDKYISRLMRPQWPFPNVMLGTTVWDQASADENIPHLLDSPAACRFVSYEPAVGPVDLSPYLPAPPLPASMLGTLGMVPEGGFPELYEGFLDWVVMGCEKVAGNKPGRHMDPDWVGSAAVQCFKAKVPFYLKQGAYSGKVKDFTCSLFKKKPCFFSAGGDA